MAKFHGMIGYIESEETAPGVHSNNIREHSCNGDILRNYKRWETGEVVNNGLTIDNRFSIITDEFILGNTHKMRYLKIGDTAWKITSFEIQRPRIILMVGGVYDGIQA